MAIRIIRTPITRSELAEIASEEFGDVVKVVVDVRQGIMAVGGELHADEEVLLTEEAGSVREDTWGINLYPQQEEDWVEFDSMINLKPSLGNRSRGVENAEIRGKILAVIERLILS
ncbi:MAG: DUF5674 family protein [bacterium]|nr:DUF5674 family protein [bacterium]